MKNKHLYPKRAFYFVLSVLLLIVAGMTKLQAQNITFADANVKAICVANWDTDNDGELNQAEAAAVTSLDGVFMFDDELTNFDELWFFTGLTAIGEDEFNSCTSLTAISIPNAVTSIGNYAFSDCSSLISITSYACSPPTLGSNVFDNVPSALVINVPCGTSALYQAANGWSGLSNYEEFVFDLCPITFADANVKAICVAHWDTNGDGELSYAEADAVTNLGTHFKSTSITSFDELEYFTSLISIPNTAFYGCTNLISITLPSSVSALGNGSFYNCTNLAMITIYAETPPTVGTNAFKNVPTDIVVHVPCGAYDNYHNANSWSELANIQEFGTCPIVFADANVKALCVANWDTNGDSELSYAEAAVVTNLGEVFRNNSMITSFDELEFFTGLTSIGYNAFYGCSGLTSIELPNSLVSIEGQAFLSCTGLTSITIPNSVTTIGNGAFGGCNGLTSIVIPNSVTSIEVYAFNCSGLEQITVDSGNTVFDSRNNCNAIIKTTTNELLRGCKNTIIPNSVTSIGGGAFSNCVDLTTIEIPNSITSIGTNAFYNCSGLTSIVIPNSVTSIELEAFSFCSGLTSIEIPNSVTFIGQSAFWDCTSLTSIVIPSSVTSMGHNPFAGCNGLEQITVDSGNTVFDSRDNCNAIINTSTNKMVVGCKNSFIPNTVTSLGAAFYRCGSLTTIVIPNSVTSIDSWAFSNCSGLSTISISNSMTSIEEYTFSRCSSLISVTIPSSITCIGGGAFSDCTGLTSITVLANNPPSLGTNVFYRVNKSIPVYVPAGTVNAYQSASGWSEFTNYIDYGSAISFTDTNVKALCVANWDTNGDGELSYAEAATVTDLGQVFYYKTAITSFNEFQYFTGLISIGSQAFQGCSSLTSIVIPNSVTSIGFCALYNCSSLTSIVIPNSVTSIGGSAFMLCSNLTSISIPNSVTSIGSEAFNNCIGLTAITIPNSVTSIGFEAFWRCTSLTSVTIPNSVISMGENPFAGCSSLEQIIVDSGNTVYDSRENCNAIIETGTNILISGCKNTVIPDSVTSIGFSAFNGCSGLTSIVIPNSVTSIDNFAFVNCSNLTSIAMSNSMTSIGHYAFWYCRSLTSIDIPNSVTFINSDAFESCSGLTTVTIPNSVTSIVSNPFGDCDSLEQIIVDSGNTIYDSRENCNAIIETSTNILISGCKNTVIPNSVISIGFSAFYGCSGLDSIDIPNSVSYIDYEAFRYCDGLTTITIPNSVTSIGGYAFYGCSGLTSMTIFANNPPIIGDDVFYNVNKSIPVYVPCGTSNIYQNAEGWSEFTNYIELCPGTITVAASPAEGGTVAGAGYYEGGATCILTATANTGYAFINWTKDGEVISGEEIYSFVVTGDASFVANFVEIPPVPVIAEYYPDSNEPNSPYVKVHWASSSFETQIGEGTSTFGHFPFYTLYNYNPLAELNQRIFNLANRFVVDFVDVL